MGVVGACLAITLIGCNGTIGEAPHGGGPETEPTLRDPAALQCTGIEVGRSSLRRLTRDEYANTVRDLLGADGASAVTSLASDEKLGAFNANAVTPVTNLRVEQYETVAEDLAASAVTSRLDSLLAGCDTASTGEDACAQAFIDRSGRRAYRRPLTAAEKTTYGALYSTGKTLGGFAFGVQMVIEAMLQSPHFLYHVELGDPATDTGGLRPLDGWELASRLSYFVWGSMPDDELLAVAESGGITDPAELNAQAVRMLADPRAAETIASFHRQWLLIEDLALVEKDTTIFPSFDGAMRDAMETETARFADYVIRQDDGRLETLLTAPYSMLEGPLFDLYGVTAPAGYDPSEPFPLDVTQRAGLLTQPSILAKHAHADQTSPVHRGKLVRERFFCQPLPPPPPTVDTTPPTPSPTATTRERFLEHDSNPDCAGCHSMMDPIGLGFEHYDAIGAYRTMEEAGPIDATGNIVSTRDADGPFDGTVELARRLGQSDEVRECVARQWFRFAMRRIEGPADACSIARVFEAFVGSDFEIPSLMLAIVSSDAFRYRRLTPTAEETP